MRSTKRRGTGGTKRPDDDALHSSGSGSSGAASISRWFVVWRDFQFGHCFGTPKAALSQLTEEKGSKCCREDAGRGPARGGGLEKCHSGLFQRDAEKFVEILTRIRFDRHRSRRRGRMLGNNHRPRAFPAPAPRRAATRANDGLDLVLHRASAERRPETHSISRGARITRIDRAGARAFNLHSIGRIR